MTRTGLYFGSFNPIHTGHLIVAQFMLNTGHFDKILFVVSPANPFKKPEELMDEKLRYEMVSAAISDNPDFEVTDIEFNLPRPSYTMQTLEKLSEAFPSDRFSMIMGSDNLQDLHNWHRIEEIIAAVDFHIYRRGGSENVEPRVAIRSQIYDAPFLDISASYVRELMKQKKSLKYLVPEAILSLIPGKEDGN